MANSKKVEGLKREYKEKKPELLQRLRQFRETWEKGDGAIFSELAFCICTPQSSALKCDAAVQQLASRKILWRGTKKQIAKTLSKSVRFHNNKAAYISAAGALLMPGIRKKLVAVGVEGDAAAARSWLVKNVKGLGMKEASHFLRNIGFGAQVAILDRHILRNLLRFGAIREIPKALNEKNYLLIEQEMFKFSSRLGIPAAELDLLLWSKETGRIFK